MSILSRERVLTKSEVSSILDRINHKEVIKYTAIGITGMTIAKIVVENTQVIDDIFFKALPKFLSSSNYKLLGYLEVPNWFSVFVIISLIVYTIAEHRIAKNNLTDARRAKFRGGDY